MVKECGECTACCDGWLKANIYGHEMKPGMPCKYRIECGGCSIYDQRPKDPCINFRCEWLNNEEWPEFLRPDKCGVIVYEKEVKGQKCLITKETGRKIDSYILSCIIQYCQMKDKNLIYQIESRSWPLGSKEFRQSYIEWNKDE